MSGLSSVKVSRRLLLVIAVVTILLLSVLRFLRVTGTLSFWGYTLALVSGVLVITSFVVWEGAKIAPTGFANVSKKSISVMEPFEKVCETVPRVVSKNHWKLKETDIKKGHFEAKIGMSLHTFSSTMLIDISSADRRSANIHVLCGTRSLHDPGHNDKMIAKFLSGLGSALGDSKELR